MANPAYGLQAANPQLGTVTRKPQTSAKPVTGATFARLSRKAQVQGFSSTGNAYGALITQNLKPVGGWLRGLMLTVQGTGGTGTQTVTAAADAPFNVIQNIQLSDPYGAPIYHTDGYGLYLANLYGLQRGSMGIGNDPRSFPSFSGVQTTSGSGSGNFKFRVWLPLELDSSGYCSLNSQNASAQPTLTVNLNSASAVYTTGPTTNPTISVTCDQYFWAAPFQDASFGPPDPGASAQWTQQIGQQTVPSNAFGRIQIPVQGTWLHTLIFVLRDNAGVRQENLPLSDLQLLVDGVQLFTAEAIDERRDHMYAFSGIGQAGTAASPAVAGGTYSNTTPNGVFVYTFRDSVDSWRSDNSDTHDMLLNTTPATLLEVAGTFQTISSAPGTLTAYTGMLYPTSAASGIPYTHLAS